jgi:uncharacterized protein CbrC (UPF0167 family)
VGSVFRHVADAAMYACGGEQCHHCERAGLPIYRYSGEIIDPALAHDPALAAEEPEVHELCADCILGGNVRKSDDRVRQVAPTVTRFAADSARAVEEYHRLPDIPLFLQREDWPMCCGEWCEFVGVPASYEESPGVPASHSYWERGPATWRFTDQLLPESLREVSLFQCVRCSRPWFTWQMT